MAPLKIALLGLGEAGGAIGSDLVAAGADVRGFDPLIFAHPGIQQRRCDRDAVRDADLVICMTGAAEAEDALCDALPSLRPGVLWADANNTELTLKSWLATIAAEARVDFTDVALAASVSDRGLRAPMVASGSGAARFAAMIRPFGVTVTIETVTATAPN